jgi:hypothetical protein
MMAGQVAPPGWVEVCPRCKTIVDYTCSCPVDWGSFAVPLDVETLHFDTYETADAACRLLRLGGGDE